MGRRQRAAGVPAVPPLTDRAFKYSKVSQSVPESVEGLAFFPGHGRKAHGGTLGNCVWAGAAALARVVVVCAGTVPDARFVMPV